MSVGGLSCASSNSFAGLKTHPVCSMEDMTVNRLSGSKASPAQDTHAASENNPVQTLGTSSSLVSRECQSLLLLENFLTEGTTMSCYCCYIYESHDAKSEKNVIIIIVMMIIIIIINFLNAIVSYLTLYRANKSTLIHDRSQIQLDHVSSNKQLFVNMEILST